jgi:hypothetical protein
MVFNETFYFVAAKSQENVWFCYREIADDSYKEIPVKIVGGVVFNPTSLTAEELLFVETYILRLE